MVLEWGMIGKSFSKRRCPSWFYSLTDQNFARSVCEWFKYVFEFYETTGVS